MKFPVIRRDAIVAFLGGILLASTVFVAFWSSNFTVGIGSVADTRFQAGIMEHVGRFPTWNRFRSPPQFFPAENTLGYSDALLAPAAVARLFRGPGANVLQAQQSAFWLLGGCGCAGFYLLARRRLGLAALPAFALSAAWLHSAPLRTALDHGHLQLYCAVLVPWLMVAVWTAAEARQKTRLAIGGLMWGVLSLSAYYIGWTWLFYALIVGLLGWAIHTHAARSFVERGRFIARTLWPFAMGAAPPLLLFFWIYAPVWTHAGPRNWPDVRLSLPAWDAWVRIPVDSAIWGRWGFEPGAAENPLRHELRYGLSPLAMLLFVVASLGALRAGRGGNAHRATRGLGIWMAGVWIAWLLIARAGNFSLWRIIHAAIPGAAALRAVMRINLSLITPIYLAIGSWLAPRLRAGGMRRAFPAWLALLGMLLESVRFTAPPIMDLTDPNGAPPADAHAFFVAPGGHSPAPVAQASAFLLGISSGCPTLNGHSGLTPPGWHLNDPGAPHYAAAVASWMLQHHLSEIYVQSSRGTFTGPFDAWIWSAHLPVCPWNTPLPQAAPKLFTHWTVAGFSAPEPWGIWTQGERAELFLPFTWSDRPAPSAVTLHLDAQAFVHPRRPRRTVDIRANGEHIAQLHFDLARPQGVFHIPVPESAWMRGRRGNRGLLRLEIVNHHPIRPADIGAGPDLRPLGLGIHSLTVSSAPAPGG